MGLPAQNYNSQLATLGEFDAMRQKLLPEPEQWPAPMREEAFYGLAGDFVRLVEPETEADKHALLLTLLAGLGCMFGRNSFYSVGATRHHPNLFAVIAGDSAKARKGTATDCTMHLLGQIDPMFVSTRRVSGLSSGEGLISAVRDPQTSGEEAETDAGVTDKRLLVVESELAHPLQIAKRDGSTLSPIIRNAWDGTPLRVLSRKNRDSCQEPHISIIGSITVEELRRLLTANDRANGFANRFLWCCVRRSKNLPYGGQAEPNGYQAIVRRFQSALSAAATLGRIGWSEDAKEPWANIYAELGNEETGSLGLQAALTALADAQCIRIAMIYALLDSSPLILLPHLEVAVALWEYCADSVKHIFAPDAAYGPDARILSALEERDDGMTRTNISRLLGNHLKASELDGVLERLMRSNRITSESITGTGGAGRTVYRKRMAP